MTAARILVVEDEAIIAMDLCSELQRLGYGVVATAATGEEAVERARDSQPDLVLMDIRLRGGMDGIEAAAAIMRERPLPVVYLTAHSDEQTLARARATQPYGYLLKPFKQRELHIVIEVALELHRLHREREALRAELARREEAVRLVEQAPVAVAMFDRELRCLAHSRLWSAAFGGGCDDHRGRGLYETLPWLSDELRNAHRQVLAGGDCGNEEHFAEIDGTGEWFRWVAQPWRADDRTIGGLVVHFERTTERHRQDDELRTQRDELRRMNEDLERFAFLTAHDFQEPLRMVSMYLDLLRTRHRGQTLDGRAMAFVDSAQQAAVRLQTMLKDLLDYVRVGGDVGDGDSADASLALAQALENLAVRIEESGAVVEAGALPVVRMKESYLLRVLQNLVGNAIHHRAERPPIVRVSAERQGPQWRFAVADNGPGIAAEHLGRVFGMFQRLARDGCGTGIGLSVVKRLVEDCGGAIWVESEPGRGSTFFFTLPAAG